MSEDKPQVNPIIKEMEEMYPEMTKEFKRIMREQYETFCRKQMNYGPDNISLGKDLTKEEIINFVENLTKEQYSKLEEFINNFPTFEVKSAATCDKCGFDHQLSYSDFTSFFV